MSTPGAAAPASVLLDILSQVSADTPRQVTFYAAPSIAMGPSRGAVT